MATIIGHTTRAPGTILTAAIYNQDHVRHVTNAQSLNSDIELQHAIGIGLLVDGAGYPPVPGLLGDTPVPFNCRITGAYVAADQAGDAVIDLWVDTFDNYPPTIEDSITGANPITLSNDIKYSDSTLTGWEVNIPENSIIRWSLESVSLVTRMTLWLTVMKQ